MFKKIKLKYKKIFHRSKYNQDQIDIFLGQSINIGNQLGEKIIAEQESYSLKHSGKIGDIIYALPMMHSLAKRSKTKSIKLYLDLGEESGLVLDKYGNFPKLLTEEIYYSLKPLLDAQPYISSVSIYTEQPLDFDLDDFRRCVPYFSRGSLHKYYQYVIPLDIDLTKPCLEVEANSIASESILINRTARYRMQNLDYSYLNRYKTIYFVGLEHEYNELKYVIPKLKWIETKNHLELAQVIAGAKLFIGNQSSAFAIADALKINRILETDLINPDVVPVGGVSIQCCYQNQLEYATRYLFENKKR